MKHVHAKIGGIANHAQGDLFVYHHAAAPTVVYDQGIVWVFPGFGISENRAHPAAENVSGAIGTTVKSTKKNYRSFE